MRGSPETYLCCRLTEGTANLRHCPPQHSLFISWLTFSQMEKEDMSPCLLLWEKFPPFEEQALRSDPAEQMQVTKKLFLALAVAFVAFFFTSDCDVALYVLPFSNSSVEHIGKVVWVTGASSGIGASLAKDFTVAGAEVIISARRVAELEATAKECSELGAKSVKVVPLDVTDHKAQQVAYDQIIQEFGRADTRRRPSYGASPLVFGTHVCGDGLVQVQPIPAEEPTAAAAAAAAVLAVVVVELFFSSV